MPGGRPTKYDPKYVDQAYTLCSKFPATDEDLAELFQVDISTIYKWKVDHPEFSDAIKEAKQIQDHRVEKSLFERATGYTAPDTYFANFKGNIISKEYQKHYPPDPTSMIFWLKNRQPGKWRDKQEVEHSGEVGVKCRILLASDDE